MSAMSMVDSVELKMTCIVPPEPGDFARLAFRVKQANIPSAEVGGSLWLEFFSSDGPSSHNSLKIVWEKPLVNGPLDWSSWIGVPVEWLNEDVGRDEILVKVKKNPSPSIASPSGWKASNEVKAHLGFGEVPADT
jgi:hypothetical protein